MVVPSVNSSSTAALEEALAACCCSHPDPGHAGVARVPADRGELEACGAAGAGVAEDEEVLPVPTDANAAATASHTTRRSPP